VRIGEFQGDMETLRRLADGSTITVHTAPGDVVGVTHDHGGRHANLPDRATRLPTRCVSCHLTGVLLPREAVTGAANAATAAFA
jgi:hypothetical protein